MTYLQQGLAVEEHNLDYNLRAGSESQKQAYLRTLGWSSNALISFHLETAPQNAQASVLAFMTIAQRKGRLLDFMSQSQQLLHRNLDPNNQKLLDELNSAKSKLANLYHYRPDQITPDYQQQLEQLSQEITSGEAKLSRHSDLYRLSKQPITLENIQQQLPDDTAVIEFVKYQPYNPQQGNWGEPRYGVYILHNQGIPQGIDLGTVAQIESKLLPLKLALYDPGTKREQVQASAHLVYQILMEPLGEHLGNSRKLLIAPAHNLNTIPFEALVDENNEYLVKNYQISYLTSSRDLVRMTSNHKSKNPALVMGNPNFQKAVAFKPESEDSFEESNPDGERQRAWSNLTKLGFSAIPHTEIEVKAIADLLGVEPLIQTEATESVAKRTNRPQILHIATHGFFRTSNSTDKQTFKEHPLLLSGIVLAGFQQQSQEQQGDDGILTALEVSGINLLGTKLVILSACDTGRGNISAGDGIYGLRRALVIAGAETQVISLWRVDDASTKELMIAYYQRLKRGEGRSEALRQTQLDILEGRMEAMSQEKYQHPYYWAGFIASGNWLPMEFEK